MQRLFVGIPLPEVIRSGLEEVRTEVSGAEWVPLQNLHITLKFIGEVEQDRLLEISRILQWIRATPFLLEPGGVGVFPPKGHPGVMWVGLHKAHPELFRLQKQIDDTLFRIGIEPERRIYHPHITAARCREASEEGIRQWRKRHQEFLMPPFMVQEFVLYSSLLGRGQPIYSEQCRYGLLR